MVGPYFIETWIGGVRLPKSFHLYTKMYNKTRKIFP